MDEKVNVEDLLYRNYIQYNRLFELTKYAFYKSDAENVDLYIDMNSLLQILYTNKNIIIKDYSVITSSMINLCAHLRNYFWTRHRVMSRIFIVYGDNFPEYPKQFYPDYNSRIYENYINNPMITDFIKSNFELLDTICPYLLDIFFIHGENVETSVLMYDIMLKQDFYRRSNNYSLVPNIVFTRDPYAYQLVSMEPKTFIYRPKKHMSQDGSWVVTKNALFQQYRVEVGAAQHEDPIISHELFSLVVSMAGLKSRNIGSVFNLTKSISNVYEACKNIKILPGYNSDIEFVANAIDYGPTKVQDVSSKVISRFKALDLVYNHIIYGTTADSLSNDKTIINLHDPAAVREINDKYFKSNPLDILRL